MNSHYMTMKINNRDNILIFDSTGMVSEIQVSSIPDMDINDNGVLLARYFNVRGEIVSSLIKPLESELKKKSKDLFIVFLTKQGFVKRTLMSEFANINGSMQAIKLPNNDELVATDFSFDDTSKDMVIYTNKGNGIRRDINEFNIMKANARGVRQITVDDDEICVGFNKIIPSCKYIFYITSAGKAKLTETKYLPSMKRQKESLSLINLDKNETLVGLSSVSKNDSVIIYRKNLPPEEIDISSMNISTRVAKAEKLVKTPKGDRVLSYKIIIR